MSQILVTGATGGLGAAVVVELQRRGWNVYGASRADGDLTVPEHAHELIHKVGKTLSGVVHLAGGIAAGKPLEEQAVDEIDLMYSLNVFTTVNILRAALPTLKANSGSIVTIGAQAVLHPVPNRAAYASAKAAVVALTQAVAEEGRPFGVRANVILPSIIKTEANLAWASEDDAKGWPTPQSIANTIADLVDPACGISGAIIPMFGTIPY